jgi:archaellum biogenesis ATPase FlaH
VQVSSTAAGALDPRKLDPLGLRSILPLVRGGRSGVILYDAIDEMIGEASLADVIRFLRKANDMAFVHGVTVIARIAPGQLPEDEVRPLRAEFDEYLDLSAQL